MATINPVETRNGDVIIVTWTGVSTSTDTPVAYGPMGRGVGCVRAGVTFGGTFGGATAALQGSNDNTTYANLLDRSGAAVSATAAKYQEFTASALYLKPSVTGGAGDNVDIVVAIRGN